MYWYSAAIDNVLVRQPALEHNLPDLILRNFTLVWKVRGNTVSNKMYKVEWEGGHQSSYPLEWLKERSFREEARTLYREKVINQACGCPPKMKIKFF